MIFSTTVTPDVQYVTATLVENMDAFVVQCDFITGSNAQGCMVVLVGEFDNMKLKFSGDVNLDQNTFEVSHPLSCYRDTEITEN